MCNIMDNLEYSTCTYVSMSHPTEVKTTPFSMNSHRQFPSNLLEGISASAVNQSSRSAQVLCWFTRVPFSMKTSVHVIVYTLTILTVKPITPLVLLRYPHLFNERQPATLTVPSGQFSDRLWFQNLALFSLTDSANSLTVFHCACRTGMSLSLALLL